MTLNASGNLGIGTTTIGSRLQVNGNAAIGYSASTAAPTNGLLVSGNVGFGTTSPNNYGNTTVTIASTAANNTGALVVRNSTDANRGHIYSDGANSTIVVGSATSTPLLLVTTDIERMRITSGGLVGIATNAPTSTLHSNGSIAAKYVSKTATYTLDSTDYTVVFNISAAATANLPSASTCTGRIYVIKVNNTTNTDALTIDPNGAQTIDGFATYTLQCQYGVMIQSDGSNWRIIADFGSGLNCL
jgi:hypothetical protein